MSFKKKLLHLQVLPILSGVQNMMLSLLSGLDRDKYDIYVISAGGGDLEKKVTEMGWTHIAIPSLCREISPKDIISAVKIWQVIRKIKPDIVHTHSSKTGFLGRIIARLAGVPLVVHTIHGFPFHEYQNQIVRQIYIILETFASLFAHYNVCVQKHERDIAVHKYGFSKDKTLTIYNGICKNGDLRIGNYERNDDDTLKIISVLRFSKQKNIVFTIEQAVRAVKKYPNVHFSFFGDGELFEKCKEMVSSSNTSANIHLHGWTSDVYEHLLQNDVFLLNSLWEGLPISILEAMSVGLPIICSNIKGNNEVVNDSNGWLIAPLDPNGIEEVVRDILSSGDAHIDKSILRKKGTESINIVTNRFSYELFIKEYQKIYER